MSSSCICICMYAVAVKLHEGREGGRKAARFLACSTTVVFQLPVSPLVPFHLQLLAWLASPARPWPKRPPLAGCVQLVVVAMVAASWGRRSVRSVPRRYASFDTK